MNSENFPLEDILTSISCHLDPVCIYTCSQVCKIWNNILSQEIYISKLETHPKINEILRYFPRFMIDALGGKLNVCKLPVLEIGNRMGNTGYIDFIYNHDMKYPIMRGVDRHKRSFVSIAYKVYDENNAYIDTKVESFFQRYVDSNYWTSGKTGSPTFIQICHGGLNSEYCDKIKNLLMGENVKTEYMNEEHYYLQLRK